MSDILAIVDQEESDDQLIAELTRRHPDRVIVLVEDGDARIEDAPRASAFSERITKLQSTIEQRTGAVVVGLANSREQLLGWRFDRIVGGQRATAAASGTAGAETARGGRLTAH